MVAGLIFNSITNMDGGRTLGLGRPAGAHRLATAIRARGYDVEVVDFFDFWTIAELKQLIEDRVDPETMFIGWSTSFYKATQEVLDDLLPWIRSRYPHLRLLAGGTNPMIAGMQGMDYYVDGFAEGAVDDLIKHIRGEALDLKAEALEDGSLYLDAIMNYPRNNWGDLAIKYEDRDFIGSDESLTIEASRGCVFKCKFCAFPIIGKKKHDHLRDPQEIRRELIANYERLGINDYVLSEETVNDSTIKLKAIYEAVKDLPFQPSFRGFFRLDLLHAHPDNIPLLRDINITGMHFGIETFNEKSGDRIGKGLAAEKQKETLHRIHDTFGDHLITQGSFIVGLPDESRDSLYRTQEWLISDDNPMDCWVWYPLAIPNADTKVRLSEFSKNFEQYGYEKQGVHPLNPRFIRWKNSEFDYFEAIELATELTKKSYPYVKLGPWTVGMCHSLGLDRSLYVGKTFAGEDAVDMDVLHQAAEQRVNSYKKNKLTVQPQQHIRAYRIN